MQIVTDKVGIERDSDLAAYATAIAFRTRRCNFPLAVIGSESMQCTCSGQNGLATFISAS